VLLWTSATRSKRRRLRMRARILTNCSDTLWLKRDHAIKATDLCQSGGFGLVALDLGDVPSQQSRRIQLSWWFRFGER
jgi:hypothetical protein